jgi:hypothetical protein
MTTKAKTTRATSKTSTSKRSSPKTTKAKAEAIPAPVASPVGPGLNDTRADGEPVVGHFVEVTKGEDKGFFGVLLEVEGETAVLRARDAAGVRKPVPFANIAPAEPYRR